MAKGEASEFEKEVVEAAIAELVIANRILAREDVIDDFGHVSIRHPLRPDRFFLSRSRSPEIVSRDDIMEFTLEGELIGEDPRAPYKERFIHGAIYKDRTDVMSVTHHHARAVLPFTMTDMPLRPIFHMASVIGKQIDCWDSQDEFGDTSMLVDTMDMGHSLSRALGENNVVLLRGHGSVCAAKSLKTVCMISIYLKENAELILKTLPVGEPKYLTDGEIEMTNAVLTGEMPTRRAWDYWKARAGFAGL